MPSVTTVKDAAAALQSLATVAALVVGAIWTYLTFVRQRLAQPRLEVKLATQVVKSDTMPLVRAHVTLRNCGSVVVTSLRAELLLLQLLPFSKELTADLADGYDPIPDGEVQLQWPLLIRRDWTWKKGEFEIEPGEEDSLCADLFVPQSAEVVELAFFIANPKKKRIGLGWSTSTICELGKGDTNVKEVTPKHATEDSGTAPAAPTAKPQPASTEASTATTATAAEKEVT